MSCWHPFFCRSEIITINHLAIQYSHCPLDVNHLLQCSHLFYFLYCLIQILIFSFCKSHFVVFSWNVCTVRTSIVIMVQLMINMIILINRPHFCVLSRSLSASSLQNSSIILNTESKSCNHSWFSHSYLMFDNNHLFFLKD